MAKAQNSVWNFIKRLFLSSIGTTSLLDVANRYEKELVPYEYVYTFKPKGKKSSTAVLRFDKGNFCHLFSIGSIVKGITTDTDQFSGMKGWNNIQEKRITYPMLRKLNPSQFEYYHKEQMMMDEFIKTLQNPRAVLYDSRKVKNSNLEADIILYEIYGQQVVHLALSKAEDGTYFCRSYFVRDVNRDKAFPTKYIVNQTPLDVKVKKRISSQY